MRELFLLLVIVGIAIIASLFAGNHDGYVLIVRQPYRLELSFNLLVFLVILAFFTLHFTLRFIAYARRLPSNVRNYRENKRRKEGQEALLDSLHALIDGRHQVAEKSASRALQLGVDPGLSALIAARAAHRLQHKNRRDFYLAESERLAPEAVNTRLLTHAEMLIDEQEYHLALQILEKIEPNHPPAMRLNLQAHLGLKDWEQVLTILKRLEKIGALEASRIREYRTEALIQLLKLYANNAITLTQFWQGVSEEDRLNPIVAQTAAKVLTAAGLSKFAIQLIQNNLTKNWDSRLVKMLGDCSFEDAQAQLQQAELWLHSHEADAGLLYTLGKLCSQLNLDQKALTYLLIGQSLYNCFDINIALAEAYEKLGNNEKALTFYKNAVKKPSFESNK